MRRLELNGSDWQARSDFYEALAAVLGSVEWHGRNADAFLETMIYLPELNAVQPPYEVVITDASAAIEPFLRDFSSWVEEARADRMADPQWGSDIDVSIVVS